jgi:hypothetical protein
VQRSPAPARSASDRRVVALFLGSIGAIYAIIAYALYALIVAVA